MSDVMRVQPVEVLLEWMLTELKRNQSIFGIPRSLFYVDAPDRPYATAAFGHRLATPIGPGAGPHTQLAQNIVCAWLSGGRFIELKTVQVMDELEIPRPCIDMEDEGYNVEWSQELKLDQSAGEYIKAWILIHILRRVLGFERLPFGTVFNMSVGYNLEGIQSPAMTRFMDCLEDASEEIGAMRAVLHRRFPQFDDIDIPARITNNVTLSTMHGCPPDEIESIATYLMRDRGLHTAVKLNPTLLGRDAVARILHDNLGFEEIRIPDAVFEHDLQFDRAVELIRNLKATATERGLSFGVKLSNTLATANHKGTLPGDEMYMSGRALYPITINLFLKLSQEFAGELDVSFSAGADALNVPAILAAGAWSVTAVSDLLKPGGYSRLRQYLESLEQAMEEQGATSLAELARDRLGNLEREAALAVQDPRYKKDYHRYGLPKVGSELDRFDCITAPCVEQCAVLQDVPEYAFLIAQGEIDRALEVILSRNPLPAVTGYVCTHLCQTRCTRNDYDQPVAIRALKRFAAERGKVALSAAAPTGHSVAVVGSGPSGLAAAFFLALNGVAVTIFEARDRAGGMLAIAPAFRLPQAVVAADIERILQLGVKIKLGHRIDSAPEDLLDQGFDAVYVASGAQKDLRLRIEGEDGQGVLRALDFLQRASLGEQPDLGQQVVVIGGGNTAMDAARTAKRLTAGTVSIVYRRTRREMPATEEEIEGILDEGIQLVELASPARIVLEGGRVTALECTRNVLGDPGPDGRRRPVPVEGSEFRLDADSVIVAISQRPDVSFLDGSAVTARKDDTIVVDGTGRTEHRQVYAGGDAVRGPAIIIEACADGRRAAQAICVQLGVAFSRPAPVLPHLSDAQIVEAKQARARKVAPNRAAMLAPEERDGFDLIEATLTEKAALAEAARCLQCSTLCDKCVEVCPNRANLTFTVSPVSVTLPRVASSGGRLEVVDHERFQIAQTRQILHVEDFCNECGNCATFCVHHGKPFKDKPRLFLDRADFEQDGGSAFTVERSGQTWTLLRREGGAQSRLSWEPGGDMTFENDVLRVTMSADDLQIGEMERKAGFEGSLSLAHAAEMAVILKGIVASLPFLPIPTH